MCDMILATYPSSLLLFLLFLSFFFFHKLKETAYLLLVYRLSHIIAFDLVLITSLAHLDFYLHIT